MPEQETPHERGRARESAAVYWNRYNLAVGVGFSEKEALKFAKHGSLEELRKLIAGDCPVELIRQIVL